MKILGWIVTLPVGVVCIALAVANRHAVKVYFDPLPFGIEARVATVVLAAFVAGVFFGMALAWISRRTSRREARISRREAKRLKKQRAEYPSQEASSGGGGPPSLTAS